METINVRKKIYLQPLFSFFLKLCFLSGLNQVFQNLLLLFEKTKEKGRRPVQL